MPTIELISIGCKKVPDLPNYSSFAFIAETGVQSHRGLFQSSFDLFDGVIVHLANKAFEGTDGCWFAGHLVDFGSHGTTLGFRPEVIPDLRHLMLKLLAASAGGWITFSTDYQFGGRRRERSKVGLSQFFKLHDGGMLRFNELWFIHGEGE